jgi:anthranilate/para-aminobenzoate synthase component II
MILVLDNYDSFTYNLVQVLGELGAEVEVRRNDQVTIKEKALAPDCATKAPAAEYMATARVPDPASDIYALMLFAE